MINVGEIEMQDSFEEFCQTMLHHKAEGNSLLIRFSDGFLIYDVVDLIYDGDQRIPMRVPTHLGIPAVIGPAILLRSPNGDRIWINEGEYLDRRKQQFTGSIYYIDDLFHKIDKG